MKSQTPKERLTIEKCRLDLVDRIPPEPILWWVYLVLGGPIVVFLAIDRLVIHLSAVTEIGIVLAYFLPMTALFTALYARAVNRRKRQILEARIRIVEDVLVNTVDHYAFKIATPGDDGIGQVLEFERYGSFALAHGGRGRYSPPEEKYYKWSDLYVMSATGVYNTSLAGDTFYLVIYDDDPEQRPAMVYNAKFFKYDEYDWSEER